ncbi:hypothetical protein B5F40_05205 [Gordonibacter sp. An230]|nr:hypothetical protein B5F40_05205 [Gordonibacter sp. An230]
MRCEPASVWETALRQVSAGRLFFDLAWADSFHVETGQALVAMVRIAGFDDGFFAVRRPSAVEAS